MKRIVTRSWLTCLTLVLVFGCEVETFFIWGGNMGSEYDLSYDGTSTLLPDEAMFLQPNEYELFTLDSYDTEGDPRSIYALYVGDQARIATDTVIIYCHGNGSTLNHAWRRITALANLGSKLNYGVMAMEYQGFGLSEGEIAEQHFYNDLETCMNWLMERGLTNDRTVVYGISLGSAPATESVHGQYPLAPDRFVLECPFAGLATLSQDVVGFSMGASFFTSDTPIDNLGKMPDIDEPLLLIHGEADTYLDYESNGLALYEAYQGVDGTLVPVPGADHADIPNVMGWEWYQEVLLDYLRKEMPTN